MTEAGDRWVRRASVVAVALYAVFLLAGQFEHHDRVSIRTTRFHCTICASSVLGSDPQAPALFERTPLVEAGGVPTAAALADGVLLSTRPIGRSPPAA